MSSSLHYGPFFGPQYSFLGPQFSEELDSSGRVTALPGAGARLRRLCVPNIVRRPFKWTPRGTLFRKLPIL